MLRTVFASLLVAGLITSPIQSLASSFVIPNSSVSFDAPTGFTALPQEEIDQKWIRKSPPSFAVGNDRRTTTIAYDLKNHYLPDEELEAGLKVFEQTFDRLVAGIVWKKKEIVVIKGQRWIHLEMTSFALDTDIYNILLCTPHHGKLLMFNFNSTKEDFPALEAALRASIQSISLESK